MDNYRRFEDVWTCTACGQANPFENHLCLQCNHRNDTVWKCTACSLLNMDEDNHCFFCSNPRAVWNAVERHLCGVRTLHAIAKDQETECLICNREVRVGDKIGVMGCTHLYHYVCLQDWMDQGNFICPTCRGPVPVRQVELIVPVLEEDP